MKKIGQKLIGYFVKGLIFVLPTITSLYVIFWLITSIEAWLDINNILGEYSPLKNIRIPGLGILFAVSLIILAGVFFSTYFSKPIQNWFLKIFNRLPFFRFIYSSVKDITEALVGDERKFTEPVLVSVNEVGMKRIGFVTKKDLEVIEVHQNVAVYFPMSYSFAGNVYIVPNERVKPLKIKASDAMKFVVSGGLIDLE